VNRAEFVIQRHLECHRTFYERAFLQHLWDTSRTFDFADAFESALKQWLGTSDTVLSQVFGLFDVNEGFLDGNRFVVPSEFSVDRDAEEVRKLFAALPYPFRNVLIPDIALVARQTEIKVPADGVIVEAIPSSCPPLPDVPEPTPNIDTNIRFSAGARP
jgi:hypothetical protein